jgi:hypothetical protein
VLGRRAPPLQRVGNADGARDPELVQGVLGPRRRSSGDPLTGPGYRHVAATPQDAGTTVLPQPALSGGDGRLTFAGWFLPGDWSLTPECTPHGYRSSGVLPVTLPAPTGSFGDSWTAVVGLAADVPDVVGTGTGGTPIVPVSPPAPRPGPTPAVRPLTGPSPAAASPTAVASRSAPPSPGPRAEESTLPLPLGDSVAASGETPPLRVTAGTSSLDGGLVGFGVLFVTVVLSGVGYLRRRARR